MVGEKRAYHQIDSLRRPVIEYVGGAPDNRQAGFSRRAGRLGRPRVQVNTGETDIDAALLAPEGNFSQHVAIAASNIHDLQWAVRGHETSAIKAVQKGDRRPVSQGQLVDPRKID